jgi:hypothetical protein
LGYVKELSVIEVLESDGWERQQQGVREGESYCLEMVDGEIFYRSLLLWLFG